MKPGDRVIWLRSPKHSFFSGWRVQKMRGVIVRVCRCRIRIKIRLGSSEKVINVDPENVVCEEDAGHGILRSDRRAI
jgi:hypothetical protein